MKNDLISSVLIKDEEMADWLKDSLTKFSCCQKVWVLSDMEEAMEYLNQDSCTLLFIDEDYLNILYTIPKPVFIVPFCSKINLSRMKRLMKMGCFDILLPENRDDQLKAILGKIINIYSFYSSSSKAPDTVADPNAEYNASMARFIFTEESIFLPATKSQPAVRIPLKEILFIQLVENKIRFIMENHDVYERRKSLKYFINRLPLNIFQKINQKTIINVQKIDQIKKGDTCCVGDMHFKITRSFKAALKSKLPL